jgi:hypothetical protein
MNTLCAACYWYLLMGPDVLLVIKLTVRYRAHLPSNCLLLQNIPLVQSNYKNSKVQQTIQFIGFMYVYELKKNTSRTIL